MIREIVFDEVDKIPSSEIDENKIIALKVIYKPFYVYNYIPPSRIYILKKRNGYYKFESLYPTEISLFADEEKGNISLRQLINNQTAKVYQFDTQDDFLMWAIEPDEV